MSHRAALSEVVCPGAHVLCATSSSSSFGYNGARYTPYVGLAVKAATSPLSASALLLASHIAICVPMLAA